MFIIEAISRVLAITAERITMSRVRERARWTAAGAAGAIVLGSVCVAGFAIAQTSGGDQFTACLSDKGDLISVAIGAEPSAPCKDRDTPVSWNQTGPQGQPGKDGAPGTAGAPGPQGEPGADGVPGTSGGLDLVDAAGAVIGTVARFDLGTGPYLGKEPVLAVVDSRFVWIGRDGRQTPLSRALLGNVYFETTDCTGPPSAVSGAPRDVWYEVAYPWPEEGSNRRGYAPTSTKVEWIGQSTRFLSRWQAGGTYYPSPDECVPGPQGGVGMLSTAYEVVEIPDALILDDFVGPLTIQVASP